MAEGINLYRHPSYAELAKNWQIYKDLYDGDHATLVTEDYLWPHLLEKKADGAVIRSIREMRTRYTAYLEAVVSALVSIMFKNTPNYEEVEKILPEEERKNIDGKGKHLTTFIQLAMRDYLIYGRPIILVDAFNIKVKTKRQEAELGIRPFLELLSPLSVVAWETETEDLSKYGMFKWVRCEYDYIKPTADETVKPETIRRSTVFGLSPTGNYQYKIYESTKKQDEKIESNKETWKLVLGPVEVKELKAVPVCTIWDQESWVKDVAQEVLRHHNLSSTYDNCLNNQAYQRSWIAGNIQEENWKEVGENVIGRLPEGSTIFTIEPANTASLQVRLAQCVNDIFKIAFNQSRSLPADSGVAESAVTLRERKEELHALLESSIQEMQDLINQAVKFYALFKGTKDFTGQIKFSTDISSEDIDEQIKIYSAMRDRIAKYPTWQKSSDKKFAELQNLPQIEEIKEEIENTTIEVVEDPSLEQQPTTIRERLAQQVNSGDQNGTQQ